MIDISITQNLKVLSLVLPQSLSLSLCVSPLSLIYNTLSTTQNFHIFPMSQFSSESLWWSHHHSHRSFPTHPPPPPTTTNNHFLWLESQQATALSASMNFNFIPDENMEEEVEEDDHQNNDGEREFMFEKPLTPSDVGKLNRLVIPKQYAEKYFPLGGESVEKGLLLSFEDEAEKVWRFRYSYWNSSQSYVLTKGWSRFVKEKQLDAGDVVWFERRRSDGQHLFIRWRRRVPPPQTVVEQTTTISSPPRHHHQVVHASHANAPSGSSGGWTQMFYSAHPYPPHHVHGSLLYQPPPDCLHAAVEQPQQNPKTVKGNSKQLRLFGVTLDCQADDDDEDDDDEQQSEPAVVSDGSSYATTHHFFHPYQQQQHDSSSSHSHRYQEYDFSRDMDQTRYDRGRDMSM